MKQTRIFIPAILSLLSLTTANVAHAETTISTADNGNLSVTGMIPGNGCTVLFSPKGRMIEKGSSCSSKEINKAQKAIDSYVREQNSSAGDEYPSNGYADTEAGGPDFWEITGVANNDLGLKAEPSLNTSFTVKGLRNGTILRNLGCKDRDGDRWCRVEVENNPSQNGWARMQYLRESSGSSHSNSGNHRVRLWEVQGVENNDLGLKASPSLNAAFQVRGLRNGTILENLGCETHGPDVWCHVKVQDNPSQQGWARQFYLRKYR